MSRTVNKKNTFFFAIVMLLFITLLRSQIRVNESGFFDRNSAARRADYTLTAHTFSPTSGRRRPPSAGRLELNRLKTEHDNREPNKAEAGGPAWSGAVIRPPCIYDWLDELIEKIRLVESGGDTNPPDGDGGQAVGALQLHKCVVDDVNRYWRTNFSYADRRDFPKAELIARLYLQMWLDCHKEEIAARIFNGGPRGWQKKNTDAYWQKIKETECTHQSTETNSTPFCRQQAGRR